jgi:hypothetical protein
MNYDDLQRRMFFDESIRRSLESADAAAQARRLLELSDPTRQALEEINRLSGINSVSQQLLQAQMQPHNFLLASPYDIRQFDGLQRLNAKDFVSDRLATYWSKYEQNFIVPEKERLTQLAIEALVPSSNLVSIEDTISQMSRLTSPWLDTRHELASITSLATIQAIGFGVHNTPFEPEFMTTLRGQLGDWRDVETAPPTIFEDAAERSEFYIARGFRSELVAFTPDALEEIVENAGLRADDEENFELHEGTYAHIIRVERKLRKHVNAVMTKAFGENWMSFDGDMVARWKATKEKRLAEGQPERPHLIHYSELSDLCLIMERKNHFSLFKPVFKRQEAMQEVFRRIIPARHAVMHDGIVTPIDFLTVMADHANILQALKRQE